MAASNPAQSKFQILYLVKNAPGVSYQALMDKCISGLYMDFFTFSEVYGELTAGDLISRRIEDTGTGEVLGKNEILTLTEGGEAVLSDLVVTLNPQMRINLDSLAGELSEQIRKMNSARAFVTPEEDGRLKVSLEGQDISLTLMAEDRESADRICEAWRTASGNIERLIMEELLKE